MRSEFALPRLYGRRITIVRRCYIALAALIMFLIAANILCDTFTYLIYEPAIARYGFVINNANTPAPLANPVWQSPGAAKIPEESRIVGIDGTALHKDDTYLHAERLIAHAGPVLTLDVIDDSGQVSRHRLERGSHGGSRIIPGENVSLFADNLAEMIAEYLGDFVPLLISLTLFYRRTADPEAMLFAFAFLLMSNIASSVDGWAPLVGLPGPWLIEPIQRISFFTGMTLMLAGICGFPDGRFTTRWSRVVAVLQILWGLYMTFGAPFFRGIIPNYHSVDVAVFSSSLFSLVLRYRQLSPGIKRQQIKWALFGAVIMALAAAITLLTDLPAVAHHLGPLELITDNLNVFKELAFPLGLFVSLLRFRLYDADNVIFRSAGFGGLTLALVAVFSAAEQITQSASQQYFGDSLGNWSAGIGAAAAAFTIGPLNKRIMHTIERRFRSKMVLLRDGLPLLLGEMRETSTPQVLAEATLSRIEEGVHARCGAIVQGGVILALHDVEESKVTTWLAGHSRDPAKRVREIERSDKLFPVRIALPGFHERDQGWLLLGARPDGSLYPHEEREMLSDAAEAIARSLAVAAKRRERDDRQDQEIAALRQLTANLERETRRLGNVIERMQRG
jgi:hypothetical protein